MSPDDRLILESVDKVYGSSASGVHAVKKLDLSVRAGEIVALLGSSGCGKTSTLRMVAGFERVTGGSIRLAGRQIHGLAPSRRNVAMAFEGYSLYPTVDARDNIAFALKSRRLDGRGIAERVGQVADMLQIHDILDKFPHAMSGGQQQRVSLARALVRDADLHLLDEPMGQLEPQLRTLLRGRIKHYIKERGITAILVTHDQTEANALADRIAVMEDGELQQFGAPDEIKEMPSNLFTGTFIGEPPMNVFPARLRHAQGELVFELQGGARLAYSEGDFAPAVRDAMLSKPEIVIGVRPYSIYRSADGSPAKVTTSQWLGDQTHIAVSFAEQSAVLVEHERAPIADGESVGIAVRSSDLHVFDPASGRAICHGNQLAANA